MTFLDLKMGPQFRCVCEIKAVVHDPLISFSIYLIMAMSSCLFGKW